jgi:phosphotransferase system  glucose/maltose/N-acetylglucosamine-specific IIC component
MAEYINIRGQSIEVVASDPANPTLGQIWYNSTSNTLKGFSVTTAGAWATGNNMNTGRYRMASFGLQTAAVAATGYDPIGRVTIN